jgi:hypothetical protein
MAEENNKGVANNYSVIIFCELFMLPAGRLPRLRDG